MKIKYKIVWLDDKPKAMEKYIDEIKSILEENYFIPDIQKPYTSYEDFHSSFESSDEVFNDCDLLLIDYNIAEKQENELKTGVTIIKELRNKNIYTETVFYSDAMEDYRKKSNRDELDNVLYADKNELVNKVACIIKKSVVQSMIISNLRGYLMDCTSDFDFICRTVSRYYFEKLNDKQQLELLRKAEEYIHIQYKSENSKFEKINKKYKIKKEFKDNVNFENLSNIFTYSGITDKDKRIDLLQEIFNSQESVITVKHKFRLLALILQKNNVDNYSDICKIDDESSNALENDKYYVAIIKHRNSLAHNKLKYGTNCKSRIKIIKTLEDMTCNCDINKCEKSYSYDDCKKLRESIYNFYLLFNKLFDKINIS